MKIEWNAEYYPMCEDSDCETCGGTSVDVKYTNEKHGLEVWGDIHDVYVESLLLVLGEVVSRELMYRRTFEQLKALLDDMGIEVEINY